jgi:hypothetical protein
LNADTVTQLEGNPPRRLRLILRDHRVLTADARVTRGQDLFSYLTSRTRYMNLTDVEWLGTQEQVDFMALKVDQILWAAPEDGELPLTRGLAVRSAKRVELELEGGYLITGGLLLIQDQRVSDYFRSAPRFVPLSNAVLRPRGRSLGDVAVHQEGIHVVRELTGPDAEADARAAMGQATGADGQGGRFQSVQDITAAYVPDEDADAPPPDDSTGDPADENPAGGDASETNAEPHTSSP